MKHWLFVAIILTMCSSHARAETDMPNIILFLVDDMGLMDTSVPMLTDQRAKRSA